MKKIIFTLAIIIFILVGQVPVSQALVDNNVYSLGFGDDKGVWRTMPDQFSFYLGCPNGYYSTGQSMISGTIDFNAQKVFYCWLPGMSELEYSATAFGRALYGGLLPYKNNSSGFNMFGSNNTEIMPKIENFSWKAQNWDSNQGKFIEKTVGVKGYYFDRYFSNKGSAQATIKAISDAISANGLGLSEYNQQDDGNFFLKGYAKKQDQGDKFIACKITAKNISGGDPYFLGKGSGNSSGYSGGGYSIGGGSHQYYSVRTSCGTYQ